MYITKASLKTGVVRFLKTRKNLYDTLGHCLNINLGQFLKPQIYALLFFSIY